MKREGMPKGPLTYEDYIYNIITNVNNPQPKNEWETCDIFT